MVKGLSDDYNGLDLGISADDSGKDLVQMGKGRENAKRRRCIQLAKRCQPYYPTLGCASESAAFQISENTKECTKEPFEMLLLL